jgi:O-antigen/teichoic acid export membrane protein
MVIYRAHDTTLKTIFTYFNLFLIGQVMIELVATTFQIQQKYTIMALWQLVPNISRLLIVIILLYLYNYNLSSVQLSYIYASIGLLFSIIGVYFLYHFYSKYSPSNPDNNNNLVHTEVNLKTLINNIWPFALSPLLSYIYLQSDIIFLKYMLSNKHAGYYSVSFIVISAILILPSVLYQKYLMSKYHYWFNYNPSKLIDVYKKLNVILLCSGIFFMILTYNLSEEIIYFAFKDNYKKSINLLKALSINLPICFMLYNPGTILLADSLIKLKIKIMICAALLNILLNYLLIPRYGTYGAVIATIASNIILFLLYFRTVRRNLNTGYSHTVSKNITLNNTPIS